MGINQQKFLQQTNNVVKQSEITSKTNYLSRRKFMQQAGTIAAVGTAGALLVNQTAHADVNWRELIDPNRQLDATANGQYVIADPATPKDKAQSYNNFYELGTAKGDPVRNQNYYTSTPWQIKIGGLVKNPITLDLDDLLKLAPLEERTYRLRCVEAWSMVVPWIGYSLSHIINKAEPLSDAKYVSYKTFDPNELFADDANNSVDWPYREGLTLAEAMHPLCLFCVGMYGETLPNQNGAPVRIVTPWKYGFKSIKAIVSIDLTANKPQTSWNMLQPSEYGFYSNVNPNVSHPRWSQASERVIDSGFFPSRRETEFLNGYADQVASLYTDVDLVKNF